MLVYDTTDRKSFDAVPAWVDDIKTHTDVKYMTIALIGNKSDCAEKRVVEVYFFHSSFLFFLTRIFIVLSFFCTGIFRSFFRAGIFRSLFISYRCISFFLSFVPVYFVLSLFRTGVFLSFCLSYRYISYFLSYRYISFFLSFVPVYFFLSVLPAYFFLSFFLTAEYEEGVQLAAEHDIVLFFETSAKTGLNVEQAFLSLVEVTKRRIFKDEGTHPNP